MIIDERCQNLLKEIMDTHCENKTPLFNSFFNPSSTMFMTFSEKISKSLDKYWIFRGKKREKYSSTKMIEIDIVRGGDV